MREGPDCSTNVFEKQSKCDAICKTLFSHDLFSAIVLLNSWKKPNKGNCMDLATALTNTYEDYLVDSKFYDYYHNQASPPELPEGFTLNNMQIIAHNALLKSFNLVMITLKKNQNSAKPNILQEKEIHYLNDLLALQNQLTENYNQELLAAIAQKTRNVCTCVTLIMNRLAQ